jgi:hypothetical protein
MIVSTSPAPPGVFLVRACVYQNEAGETVSGTDVFPVVAYRTVQNDNGGLRTEPLIQISDHPEELLTIRRADIVADPGPAGTVWRSAIRPTAAQLDALRADMLRLAEARERSRLERMKLIEA